MKLIIQVPCLDEEDQLPISLGRPAARGRGLRRRRVAHHRRRVHRPDHRGGQGARGRPHRQADEQQGPGVRVPSRAGRVPEARRRRHREHRRRQPVLRRRHPRARRADPRGQRGHGDRRPGRDGHRGVLDGEEAPPAGRELGGAAGVGHLGPRRHVWLPGLQPRGGPRAHGRVPVHLHPRVADPGGQEPGGRRPRGGGHQREAPRVAPLRVDVGLRAAQRRGHLPHLRRATSR